MLIYGIIERYRQKLKIEEMISVELFKKLINLGILFKPILIIFVLFLNK